MENQSDSTKSAAKGKAKSESAQLTVSAERLSFLETMVKHLEAELAQRTAEITRLVKDLEQAQGKITGKIGMGGVRNELVK